MLMLQVDIKILKIEQELREPYDFSPEGRARSAGSAIFSFGREACMNG